VELLGVPGLPEFAAGMDLAAAICSAAPWLVDGDLLVVSSKVVAKVEGQTAEGSRQEAVAAETRAVVARRGPTRIVRTRHGLVLAAAGVDESNTERPLLLPADSDASARRLRAAIGERSGRSVGVVISDTAGRPWRVGQTDIAIGAAGVTPLLDLRGTTDADGRPLQVTMPAVADALAAGAELVKGKADRVPVSVWRGSGLVTVEDGPGAASLVRPDEEDLFRYAGSELLLARRTVRRFATAPVGDDAIRRAVAAASVAPAPHHSRPWRFVQCAPATARGLLDALADAWRQDLRGDGLPEEAIERRIAHGAVLRDVPVLLVPCLLIDAGHDYPDWRRQQAEERMFWMALGAGIENLLLSLTDDGLATAWVSSTLFAPEVARRVLDLPADWHPAGAIAVGYPAHPSAPRDDPDGTDLLLQR
jgi:coenzyme F420-0:L-glutamate ligase/coenzyme F420-1:gamma-L-glutamate ligase